MGPDGAGLCEAALSAGSAFESRLLPAVNQQAARSDRAAALTQDVQVRLEWIDYLYVYNVYIISRGVYNVYIISRGVYNVYIISVEKYLYNRIYYL